MKETGREAAKKKKKKELNERLGYCTTTFNDGS